MENWKSVVKGRSNTCAVVGDKIFGLNAHTFKLIIIIIMFISYIAQSSMR